jgi:DNA-directed RNA polymerase subunit beta
MDHIAMTREGCRCLVRISRMNVGQVFECLLGCWRKVGNRFKVTPFDEIYGKEASCTCQSKLKEAAIKTNCKWILIHYPGKILLRDGRTGEYFDNPITVGKSYI